MLSGKIAEASASGLVIDKVLEMSKKTHPD